MNRLQEKLLSEVLEHEDKLNDWERRFIDSLYNLDASIALSTDRNAKLNQIHQKVVFDRY